MGSKKEIFSEIENLLWKGEQKLEPGVLLKVFDIPNLICTHALSTVISVCGLHRIDFISPVNRGVFFYFKLYLNTT